MDKNEAFNVLVEVTGQISANRQTHVAIQQALDTMKLLITMSEKKKTITNKEAK